MTENIREGTVAGFFYPECRDDLMQQVSSFLNAAQPSALQPKAMILPHAGYVYSGPIAATGYAALGKKADQIQTVILLGPSHRVSFHGLAAPTQDTFLTPLGSIPIDHEKLKSLQRFKQFLFFDAAHDQEHSLEVHLPFLQNVLGPFKLLPLAVGDASTEEVCEILEALYEDQHTLIIVSSDLSHYLSYEKCTALDRRTATAIEKMDAKHIEPHQACGQIPILGLLKFAQQKKFSVKTLDLRNSGDTAGSKDRVVGYGAFAFFVDRET